MCYIEGAWVNYLKRKGIVDKNQTELVGTVKTIKYRHEDNGFTVFNLEYGAQLITVTGNFTSIHEDEYVRLLGQKARHRVFGMQFQCHRKLPHNTLEGIKRYLASRKIKGIGAKTAGKIVDFFGAETLEILDDTPNRLLEVDSIGKKKLLAILDGWEEHRESRAVELFLMNQQLSPRLAVKIMKHYGDGTMDILTKNPYRLAMDIKGIGFISADRFALSLGIARDSQERISAAICYALRRAEEDGHCYLDDVSLLKELADITRLSLEALEEKVPACLLDLNRNSYAVSVNHHEGSIHYLKVLFDAEKAVSRAVLDQLERPFSVDKGKLEIWLKAYEKEQKQELSGDQRKAVRQAATHPVFILTGGPGVGKSTTANAIIKLLEGMGQKVALAAPTGRAAQRLHSLTGVEAKTIHRLLGWSPKEGFLKNEDQKIEANAIIIDEASMLDLRLARDLFAAIDPKSQVIFLGDADQLPSVGAGNVLFDLLESKAVPYVRLEEIFRQAAKSQIIKSAHKINQGVLPVFENTKESDCRFIEVENSATCLSSIKTLIGEILPKKTGHHPIHDIQVLSPMKKTDLGTDRLNSELQELLNPSQPGERELKRQGDSLRRNDKVIQISNNYELGVFNGDIGYVVDAAVQGGKVIVSFGNKEITYTELQARDLRLAYAITIHKSQGSEFPVVVIPTSMAHHVMLQRNLFYTALTRAKKLAIFVGSKGALKKAIHTNSAHARKTRLGHLVKEGQLS